MFCPIVFSSHRPTWVPQCHPSLTMSTPSLLPQPPLATLKAERSTRTSAPCPKDVRNTRTKQKNHFFFSSAGKDWKQRDNEWYLLEECYVTSKLIVCPLAPTQCIPLWGLCMKLCFKSASDSRTPGPAAIFTRTLLLKWMTYVTPWLR